MYMSVNTTVELTHLCMDINCLKRSISIVKTLTDSLPEDSEIVSNTTGEVIEIKELSRVMGILQGLIDNSEWTLQKAVNNNKSHIM